MFLEYFIGFISEKKEKHFKNITASQIYFENSGDFTYFFYANRMLFLRKRIEYCIFFVFILFSRYLSPSLPFYPSIPHSLRVYDVPGGD